MAKLNTTEYNNTLHYLSKLERNGARDALGGVKRFSSDLEFRGEACGISSDNRIFSLIILFCVKVRKVFF